MSVSLFRGPDAQRQALASIPDRCGVRAPHHTASTRAILGQVFQAPDGWRFQPGELSLVGSGTLLLSDFPEFRRGTVDALGRALRDGLSFVLPGTNGQRLHVTLGAPRVVLTATDCPCGVPTACACTAGAKARFDRRIESMRALLECGP